MPTYGYGNPQRSQLGRGMLFPGGWPQPQMGPSPPPVNPMSGLSVGGGMPQPGMPQTGLGARLGGGLGGLLGGGFNAGKFSNNLLKSGADAGLFDPTGSPRIRALARQRAIRIADAQRRRAGTLGRLVGLDPYAQRQALTEADMGATQGLGDALNNVEYAQLTSNQDRLWQLLNGERDRQAQAAAAAAQQKAGRSGAFGNIFGSLGSALLGRVAL